ncbi:MAG: L,D-transpeptidase family protein [Ruminococcus sp.]
MPFNGGIGFHDATWQAYFGGDRYTYAGSHGCINMPLDAAATLYSIIDTNVPIVCFY